MWSDMACQYAPSDATQIHLRANILHPIACKDLQSRGQGFFAFPSNATAPASSVHIAMHVELPLLLFLL
jgi:hypothetical protein